MEAHLLILRWKNTIFYCIFAALGIVFSILSGGSAFVAILWFIGLPGIYLLVRYMWLRLCRDPFLSPTSTMVGETWKLLSTCPPQFQRAAPTFTFLIFIGVCFFGGLLSAPLGHSTLEPPIFSILFYNGFGSLVVLICAVWFVDGLWFFWLIFGEGMWRKNYDALATWWWRPTVTTEVDATQQKLAQYRAATIILLYMLWTGLSVAAAYNPRILDLDVPVPRLPAACDGYRLAVAADLHAGALAGVRDTEALVSYLNAMNPDAVALVGDIGDQVVNSALRKKLAPLVNIVAHDGVYWSPGNHENLVSIEDYRALFRKESPFAGKIIAIENEHVVLNRSNDTDNDGCSIILAGMADYSGHGGNQYSPGQVAPDLDKALHYTPGPNGTSIETDPPSSQLPLIMMQHQPMDMKKSVESGVGLQLSGHTHGGQLWPQHAILYINGYDGISGLHSYESKDGPSYLFVSEGIVGWGPRLRFLCKTDVTLIKLRSPEVFEGAADTSITLATAAMIFAIIITPLSLIGTCVPIFFCLRGKWCHREYFIANFDSDESTGRHSV